MKENIVDIPNFGKISLKNIVLDYNGTIAKDGVLKLSVGKLLEKLSSNYTLHVITADTFGSVAKELAAFDVSIKVLSSENHTAEKGAYINSLGHQQCIAFGNGNNDKIMLTNAAIGIAIVGEEGCATQSMMASDIVCKSIEEGLELLLNTKRLVATLRR